MSNWLDDLLGSKKEIEKQAEQTDASQEFERKVKANSWIVETMATDEESLIKEEADKAIAAEALLNVEAAEKELTTPEEVIDEDRERQVKALSNKALAEALAEYRLQGKGLPENFSEEKEKAEKKVDSDREAAEKELLKFVGEHSQFDWKASFEKWSKAEPEHTEAKDLESDEFKAGKQNWEKKNREDFEPTKEDVKSQTEGIGHEEEKKAIGDEKLLEEQRKEASLEIENHASKADVLKKVAEVQSPWTVIKDAEGNDVIARIETEKTTKESEETEKDLQK